METIIHFFKHTLGLCGCCPKTLMTMLMSGGGLVGVMTIYWTDIKNKFRRKQMNKLLKASRDKYEAQKSEALAHLEILFNKSVGIGEHTDILSEIDKWLDSLSQAEEKIDTLNKNFGEND